MENGRQFLAKMTPELAKILTDIEDLIGAWKDDPEAKEEEFLAKLKELNDALTAKLKEAQLEQKTI